MFKGRFTLPGWLPSIAVMLVAIPVLFSCSKKEYYVELEYADGSDGPSLPYWTPNRLDLVPPDSVGVPLTLPETCAGNGLAGQLTIGNSGRPLYLLLCKADSRSLYYDHLYIDANQDANFTNDGPPLASTGQFIKARNRHYTEFRSIDLPYQWHLGQSVEREKMLATFYFYYPESGPPRTGNLVRESWRQGSFRYKDNAVQVVLVDDDCNGIFDTNDRWALIPTDSLGTTYLASMTHFRDATQLGWVGETAFELVELFPRGDGARLVVKPVDMTREEDLSRETPYIEEPRRPRAARAIEWQSDLTEATQRARRTGKHLLLNFCTSWSGPCLVLDERTFQDAEVVALTDHFVAVKLDGDRERAHVRTYNIQSYPTLVILDPRGNELSRVVGYQPAAEFAQYIKQYVKP